MPPRIGAHVRGGVVRLLTSAREVGADALQTFASNPRAWGTPNLSTDALERVASEVADAGLGPVFVHAPYLVNVASPNPAFLERSIVNLTWTLEQAAALRADGVVVHAGSAGDAPRDVALSRVRSTLLPMLDRAAVDVLVELTAGGAGAIASRWTHAAEVLDVLERHPRVRFCFDTCHAYAAGYDLANEEGLGACLEELRNTVGVERLALVHANDSKDPLGSTRDRHEHLGRGTIGEEGFRALMASPVTELVPIIVETPPDGQAADIATLRRLASS